MITKKKIKAPIIVLLVLSMILVLLPVSSFKTYAAEISIKDGEFKISDLIKSVEDGGQGLAPGDTLVVGSDTTLVVDVDFALDRIIPSSFISNLIIRGTNTLTVYNGINVGTSGTFTMESGTLRVTGPYPTGNPSAGIYAPTTSIIGGTIDIVFDDPTNPNQCGFNSDWFMLNDGQVTVDISGSGAGYTCGIYAYNPTGSVLINGGTLDIDVENSFGYPYGIYDQEKNYVVDIRGGTTNVKVKRTNSDSNYADARGITGESFDGEGLCFYMSDGSLTVDVVNKGQDAYGITGMFFGISGGTLDIIAVTEKEGCAGCGIKTDENANFLMSGGDVTTKGVTYSTASGTGRGIEYWNSDSSRRMDISGGTLTATGTGAGIHVYNSSGNELVPNQIYGNAKVTVNGGYTEPSIYGVRDGGWKIFENAELSSTSAQFNGLSTEGSLEIIDTPTVKLTGQSISGINRCAVYAEKGIVIGDTLEILTEEGPGEVDTIEAGSYIKCLAYNRFAKEANIQPKDLVKAHVLFFDEVTGKKITDGSVMVYKNDGPWQAAGSEAITFNVGKGEDFTLTVGAPSGSEFTFNGWYKGGYPGSPFSKNTTITQNITSDTWYYAEFSPPKTEIPSVTLTSDKEPIPGMTRQDKPEVSVEEEGITITGTAWLDKDGHHLAEDYVFTAGDQIMLMIDYVVDKGYILSSDIESHTYLNGFAVSIHDVADTAVYQLYTITDKKNGWEKEDGSWYYYKDDVKQTGWLLDGDTWYYLDPSGKMLTGWIKPGDTWYYLNPSGAMATGWLKLGTTWYYLKPSGAMAVGWVLDGDTWYYMNPSGAMAVGWVKVGYTWYYMKPSGAMAASEWVPGYYWVSASGAWTYQPIGSWKKNSTGWWFGDTSGWYAKDETIKIDGVKYTFDANGYWIE